MHGCLKRQISVRVRFMLYGSDAIDVSIVFAQWIVKVPSTLAYIYCSNSSSSLIHAIHLQPHKLKIDKVLIKETKHKVQNL